MYKELVISIIIGLDDIDFLFYLLGNLDNLVEIAPGGNRVLVNTLDAGRRHVQTLDIHLSACEHSGNLIQDTRHVLRINEEGKE